jgi:hypothetical protein
MKKLSQAFVFVLTLSEEASGAGDEDALALEIPCDPLRVQASIHHHHDRQIPLLLLLLLLSSFFLLLLQRENGI